MCNEVAYQDKERQRAFYFILVRPIRFFLIEYVKTKEQNVAILN